MSGAVFEWLSSNTKIDYPFSERQLDRTHELFVDAYVQHNTHRDKQDLRVESFDPAGDVTLRFGDGTLLATLTSADDFFSQVFGSYTVYGWKRATTIGVGFTDEDLAVHLVVLTAEVGNFSYPLSPLPGSLLASLVNPRVNRVRRIALALPGQPVGVGYPNNGFTKEQVILEAGNNMQLSETDPARTDGLGIVSPDVVRAKDTVVMTAQSGLGVGQFIDCETDVPAIKRLNAVSPDEYGNFQLEGRDCLWTEREVDSILAPIRDNTDRLISVLPSIMRIHQDCLACCECDDYGEAYEAIKRTWSDAQGVANRVERIRLQYNILVGIIVLQKDAREDGLNVALIPVARPDFHLALAAIIYNNSEEDLGAVTLTFDLVTAGFTYTIRSGILDTEGLNNVQMDPLLTGTEVEVSIPGLRSTKWATYTFDVRYGPDLPGRAGATIKPKVTAVSAAQTAVAQTTVRLSGPLSKV